MKVWIDLTNPAHVVVLRPLVDLLEAGGHEVTLTARPLSHTIELLDDWGHPYTAIGHHGGAGKLSKALAAGSRVARAFGFARGKNFDYGLAHGSTDLPPVGRVLGIPNTTMFDYEWARLQHEVNCRLATRVLVPDAIPADRLAQYGARPPKLVVSGDHSAVFDAVVDVLVERLGAQRAVVPGAGHGIPRAPGYPVTLAAFLDSA